MQKLTAWLLVLVAAIVANAQEPEQEPPAELPEVAALDTPSKAVQAAWQDILSLPPTERPFQYYVWIRDGEPLKAQTCNFMVNNVIVEMASTVVVQPVVINNGYLLRYDTRALGPSDIARMHRLLDKVIDPAFYLVQPGGVRVKIPTEPYRARDGKVYDYRVEERELVVFGNSVADVYQEAVNLQAESRRMVPLVSYEYLLHKTQSQIDDNLYYEFIGADIETKDGASQLEVYLKKWAGVTLHEVVNEYLDQRSVTVLSKVTGKERMVILFKGYKNKPGINSSQWSITLDVFDNALDPEESPIRNLGSIHRPLFKFGGAEIIGERANGGNVYLLADGDLNFVDEAPPNLATDHLIPASYGSARLEPPISCYRCHIMKDNPEDPEPMGWKAMELDAKNLLSGTHAGEQGPIALDIYSDPKELEVLVGRYEADFNKPFRRLREDYSDFVVRCTQNPEVSTTQVLQALSDHFAEYEYQMVTSETVVRELGIPVPEGMDSLEALRTALLRKAQTFPTQDPFIARLLIGGGIRRESWETIQQDVAKLITPADLLQQMSEIRSQAELPVGKFLTDDPENDNEPL